MINLRGQLELIDELALLVQNQIAGEDRESFISNREVSDLASYRLGTIGEYIKRIPDDIRDRYPNLPWKEMAGFRDIMAHHYDRLDTNIVWRTATTRLEEVRKCAEQNFSASISNGRERNARSATAMGDGIADGLGQYQTGCAVKVAQKRAGWNNGCRQRTLSRQT